jgi:primosomal protein N''
MLLTFATSRLIAQVPNLSRYLTSFSIETDTATHNPIQSTMHIYEVRPRKITAASI